MTPHSFITNSAGVAASSHRIAWGSGSSNPRGGSRGDADGGLALKYPTDTETNNGRSDSR